MKTTDRLPGTSRPLVALSMSALVVLPLASMQARAATAAAATGAADTASDENAGIEQIIVTANRRSENLQVVPTSISAVTAEQLKDLGVTSTTAIAQFVPGVQLMTVNSNTDNFFSIRGATQNDYAEHEESPVAVYMDGVYLSQAAGTGALLFDTERVEVLRGPQGTLFGRNATAGLVQYISKAPTDHPDGYIETSYGNYNASHTEGAFSTGITDGLSFRISLVNDYMDPYLKNALYPDKGAGNSNSRAARFQLLFKPNDYFDANLNLHGVILNDRAGLYKFLNLYPDPNNHNLSTNLPANLDFWGTCPGCDILGYKQPASYDYYTSAAEVVGYNKEHMWGSTLTLHGHLPYDLNLTSISDFSYYYKDYNEDSESSPDPLVYFWTSVDTKQYSQEIHIDNGGEGRLRWVAGLYWLRMGGRYISGGGQGETYFEEIPFGPAPGDEQRYNIDTKSWSEFAQAEFDVVKDLTLTVGGRWSTEEKVFNYNYVTQPTGIKGDPNIDTVPYFQINPELNGNDAKIHRGDWSGKVALNYKITDDIMPYVSWNKGLKAGGFSAAGNPSLPLNLFKFDEEKLYAWEVGIKTEFLDHRLRFNADVFKYSYVGYQAFNTIGINSFITNNPGKMRGGEAELTVVPISGLTIRAGLAILDAYIQDIALPDGTIADVRPSQAPKTNITFSAAYTWPLFGGSMQLGTDYSYRSLLYYSLLNDPASEQKGYGLLNLRAEYTVPNGHWSFKLYGQNVTNKEYLNNSIVGGGYGFGQASPGMPVTYGIRASYHL